MKTETETEIKKFSDEYYAEKRRLDCLRISAEYGRENPVHRPQLINSDITLNNRSKSDVNLKVCNDEKYNAIS